MNEPTHKKTALQGQPPPAATQQGLGPAPHARPTAAEVPAEPSAPEVPAVPAPAVPAELVPAVPVRIGVSATGEPAHISSPVAFGATVQAPAGDHPVPAANSVGRPAQPSPSPSQEAPLTLSLVPGEVIGGRYVVKSLAGQGGFAAVYRAADSQIPNHEVAVKLLNAPAASAQARETAMRELTLIASVSHPSVVQFKDYGWHEDRLFFAMPWYRGTTLAAAAPLDRADARRVFERSAYGLQAMHDAGICHYDIKPENIFLADIEGFEGGFPVLLDLGIAAKRGEKPTALTPDYAAPETARSVLDGGETQVGTAADVFSLALSLRNVLEPDTVASLGDSLPGFLNHRANEPIEPPTSKDLQYLKPLFERWMSLDPAERPTAAELAAELSALTAPEERRAERKRLLMRVVPVVVVLGLVATVLALQLQTATKELVETKQAGEQQSVAANQRFEKLKAESKDQLDDKLLLAQEFQSQRDQLKAQRDQIKTTLDATTTERDRARADIRARTRERDQARQEVEARTRELTQARADLQARTTDLSLRTAERDQAKSELAKQTKKVQDQDKALVDQRKTLAQQTVDLATSKADLKKARADLEDKTKDLEQAKKARTEAAADLKKRTQQLDAAQDEVKQLTKDLTKKSKELEQAREAAATSGPMQRKPAPKQL